MFRDWHEVPEWAREDVTIAVERGLISGYPDGTIRFNAPLIRGEYIVGQAKAAKRAEELAEADRRDLLRRIANAVVEVRSSTGTGSGVVLSGGRILTNAHVVGKDSSVLVCWTSPFASPEKPKVFGDKFPVVKKDESVDLALILAPETVDTTGYVEFNEAWADADFAKVSERFFGSTLYTQGSPIGLRGVISTGMFAGIRFFGHFYFVYAGSINPGNSGGGIYDLSGKLVSVVTAKPSDPLVDGLGFGVVPYFIHRFLTD